MGEQQLLLLLIPRKTYFLFVLRFIEFSAISMFHVFFSSLCNKLQTAAYAAFYDLSFLVQINSLREISSLLFVKVSSVFF